MPLNSRAGSSTLSQTWQVSRVYVGATSHPERRYRQHCETLATGRLGRWQRPLRQWVACNPHAFEILDTFRTRRMMLDAEHEYIAYLKPAFNQVS